MLFREMANQFNMKGEKGLDMGLMATIALAFNHIIKIFEGRKKQ